MSQQEIPKEQRKVPMKFDALALRTKSGVIKNIQTSVRLNVEDGTLVKMGKMKEKDENGVERPVFIVTAAGRREEAQLCGVVAMPPKTIIVNGEEQPNNYQDPKTGKVYSQSIAVGYTRLGQLTAVSRMMIYDAELANIQDLIAKASAKWNKNFFKMAPIKRDKDGNMIPPKGCNDMWAGYKVDEAMAIWVDCSAPDVFKWQREMVNKRDKAIRTCQTFAERNALAAHPALPKQGKFHQPSVKLTCTSWFAAEGTMRLDNAIADLDVEKLLEAHNVAIEDEKTVDLNEEIPQEERLGADDRVEEADYTEVESVEEDNLDMDDEGEEKPAGKKQQPPKEPKKKARGKAKPKEKADREGMIKEIDGIVESGKLPAGPRARANTAVGFEDDMSLDDLSDEQLISLRSLYRAAM